MKPFPFAIWPLQKAPTPSGLSPEEHARLTARFPSASPTPSASPAPSIRPALTPLTGNETEEQTEAHIRDWEDVHNAEFHDPLSIAYRAAGPRTGPDDEGPMRSIAVRPLTTRSRPIVTEKLVGPVAKPRENESDPIEYEYSDKLKENLNDQKSYNDILRYAIEKHIENAGSLNNGDMFLRLGLLHKNIVDHIADEYLKWHEGGEGPRPDLSKYENPVTRNADGTPWDWRKTAQDAYIFHKNASRYDDYHEYIRRFGGNWGQSSFLDSMHKINPHAIWNYIDKLINAESDVHYEGGYLPEDVKKTINLNELRKNGLHTYQYPDLVKVLMRLAIHHKNMTQLHERDSATEKSFSRQYGSVQKTNPFPFAIWPNRGNIK